MCNSKGLKHSIINDFGVVVQSNDVNKVKHFYCLANSACASTKNRYKMSHGCTSGPTDHLLSRHGIRAQKSIMADNTRAELQGRCSECYVGHWRLLYPGYTGSGLFYTGSGLFYTGSGLFYTGPSVFYTGHCIFYTGSGLLYTGSGLFYRIRLYLTFVDSKRI